MSFEETLAALLDTKLAPVQAQVGRLTLEVEALRRSLPPQLATMREAAELFGCSLSTVKRRVKDGSLPARRVGKGKTLRIDLSALHGPESSEISRLALVAKAG